MTVSRPSPRRPRAARRGYHDAPPPGEEETLAFTWIPIYEELATKLLDYEDRQDELCQLRADLQAEGLKPGLTWDHATEGGDAVPLAEIDPFTLFSSFNRGTPDPGTLRRRLKILARLKDFFGLAAPLPTDLDGVPLVDNQRSAFLTWAWMRRPDDIATLWALARQAVARKQEPAIDG